MSREWRHTLLGAGLAAIGAALASIGGPLKITLGGVALGLFETAIAKMRVFRVPDFLGAALMLGLLGTLLMFVTRSL